MTWMGDGVVIAATWPPSSIGCFFLAFLARFLVLFQTLECGRVQFGHLFQFGLQDGILHGNGREKKKNNKVHNNDQRQQNAMQEVISFWRKRNNDFQLEQGTHYLLFEERGSHGDLVLLNASSVARSLSGHVVLATTGPVFVIFHVIRHVLDRQAIEIR